MNLSNQSVLVIGGAGYIGSHVVLALCEKGYNVTVFDNLSTGHKINVDSRAQLIKGDILSKNDLQSAFNQSYDAVFHFAALKAAGESMLEPGKYTTVNITGTINILNQMIECSVQNLIFSSLPGYIFCKSATKIGSVVSVFFCTVSTPITRKKNSRGFSGRPKFNAQAWFLHSTLSPQI